MYLGLYEAVDDWYHGSHRPCGMFMQLHWPAVTELTTIRKVGTIICCTRLAINTRPSGVWLRLCRQTLQNHQPE
jgi:hypothetical protein